MKNLLKGIAHLSVDLWHDAGLSSMLFMKSTGVYDLSIRLSARVAGVAVPELKEFADKAPLIAHTRGEIISAFENSRAFMHAATDGDEEALDEAMQHVMEHVQAMQKRVDAAFEKSPPLTIVSS